MAPSFNDISLQKVIELLVRGSMIPMQKWELVQSRSRSHEDRSRQLRPNGNRMRPFLGRNVQCRSAIEGGLFRRSDKSTEKDPPPRVAQFLGLPNKKVGGHDPLSNLCESRVY